MGLQVRYPRSIQIDGFSLDSQVQAKLLDDGSQGSPPSALLRLLQPEAERLVADFDQQMLQGPVPVVVSNL